MGRSGGSAKKLAANSKSGSQTRATVEPAQLKQDSIIVGFKGGNIIFYDQNTNKIFSQPAVIEYSELDSDLDISQADIDAAEPALLNELQEHILRGGQDSTGVEVVFDEDSDNPRTIYSGIQIDHDEPVQEEALEILNEFSGPEVDRVRNLLERNYEDQAFRDALETDQEMFESEFQKEIEAKQEKEYQEYLDKEHEKEVDRLASEIATDDDKDFESLSKEAQEKYRTQAHESLTEAAVSQAESIYEN